MRPKECTLISFCILIVFWTTACCLPDIPGGYYLYGTLENATGEQAVEVTGLAVDAGDGQWLDLPDLPFGNGTSTPDGSSLGANGVARSLVTDQGTACISDQGVANIAGGTFFSDLTEVPPEPVRARLSLRLPNGTASEIIIEIPRAARMLVGKMYEINLGQIDVE